MSPLPDGRQPAPSAARPATVPEGTGLLYSSGRSPHCFKVSLLLAEKGVAFERVEIDLRAREQKSDRYLAINPLGKVPVYEDDRGIHVDSLVIVRYLDERYPEPPLFPQDAGARRAVLDWIDRMGAADLSVFAWLHGYGRFGLPPSRAPFPNLRSWQDRLTGRPSFAASFQRRGRPFDDAARRHPAPSPHSTK